MKELYEELFKTAEDYGRYMMKKEGEVQTTFFILKPDMECLVLPCGWANNRERAITLMKMRMLLDFSRALAYAHAGEVWQAVASNDPALKGLQPKDRSDRTESLMVVVVPREGEKIYSIFPIMRNENSVNISEKALEKPVNVSGELVELFM